MFGKRVGFLKFKADVIDKETGKKVDQLMASLLDFFALSLYCKAMY